MKRTFTLSKFDKLKLDNIPPKTVKTKSYEEMKNRYEEMEGQFKKLSTDLIEFYIFLIQGGESKRTSYELDREKERMQKLPPTILFDYLKGIMFKVVNNNKELKQKIPEDMEELPKLLKQ